MKIIKNFIKEAIMGICDYYCYYSTIEKEWIVHEIINETADMENFLYTCHLDDIPFYFFNTSNLHKFSLN